MTPSDVQVLFLETLGLRLSDEMTDYLVRRFQEGGAAAAPVDYAVAEEPPADSMRRFVELTDALGEGVVIPADATDPVVH